LRLLTEYLTWTKSTEDTSRFTIYSHSYFTSFIIKRQAEVFEGKLNYLRAIY